MGVEYDVDVDIDVYCDGCKGHVSEWDNTYCEACASEPADVPLETQAVAGSLEQWKFDNTLDLTPDEFSFMESVIESVERNKPLRMVR